MIINTKQMLEKAKKEKYAIPHFNINNLEWTKYILEECQNQSTPVIIGVSNSAVTYMGGFKLIVDIIKNLIEEKNITIDVAIHLDHGNSFENCKEAIDAGFTSVMIDASTYPLEENIKITKKVCDYAKKHDVTVEAEIGQIGTTDELGYAKVEDCVKLVTETQIDSLAPAIGNVHGLYHGKPNINIDRIKQIQEKTNIPLVLHGGSGIPDNIIRQAIQAGICKININTELQTAWANEVRKYLKENSKVYDPRKIISSGEITIKQTIQEKIKLLLSQDKNTKS